ncbi:MAG TPA: YfhO family protein, partial [Thermoanaerobaculia bacterium]
RSRELFYSLTTLFILGVIFAWPGIGESFHLMMPIAAHARARLLFTLLCAIQTAAAIDLARRVPLLLATLAAAVALFALTRVQMYYAYRFDSAVLAMFPGMLVLLAAIGVALTRHKAAAMALLVVIIAELFHVGRDRSMPLPDRMLYPKTPMIAKLQELAAKSPPNEPFRFAGFGAQFFPNSSAIYGLEDIRAHDPMANARYLAFLKLTADYEPWNYFAFLRDPDKPVFDYLNMKYAVLEPETPFTDPSRYALVYDGRDGRILENRNVLPRFYAVRNVFLQFNNEALYQQLRAHREWSSGAYLDRLESKDRQLRDDFLKPRPDDAPLAIAKIENAAPTDYRLRVNAPRWSLVVSSIPWWPGWKVAIDGKRVEPMRVNAVFFGFAVPRGEHDVRVWYAPISFWAGVWVCALTVIALIAMRRRFT